MKCMCGEVELSPSMLWADEPSIDGTYHIRHYSDVKCGPFIEIDEQFNARCSCGRLNLAVRNVQEAWMGTMHRTDGPCYVIENIPEPDTREDHANLGLATTEELLREVITRLEMSWTSTNLEGVANIRRALQLSEILGSMGAETREYRTVGGG
jgi:hypothetical protein